MVVVLDVGGYCELICDGDIGMLFLLDDFVVIVDVLVVMFVDWLGWDVWWIRVCDFVELECNWLLNILCYELVY